MTSKKGGSLTFPSDPLAAMRELSDLDAPVPVRASVSTDIRQPVLTDARTDASTEGSTAGRQDGRTEARQPARKAARTEGSTAARQAASQEGISQEGEFLEAVEAALASREPLTGGVKATVDMSPELSTRAKRYLADHRGQNTRQVLIALFDAFLKAKGY